MIQGKIYLVPVPLGGSSMEVLSAKVIAMIHQLDTFVVENAKTARQLIKASGTAKAISQYRIVEIDRNAPLSAWPELYSLIKEGKDVGLMSEAGMPAIADPGSELVAQAHINRVQVVPLSGPNSMMMALMASGLPGQSFCFLGYLPAKKDALRQKIVSLVNEIRLNKRTYLFMETPYRNTQMMEMLLGHVPDQFTLCVAAGLETDKEYIHTYTIKQWKKTNDFNLLEDNPAIFVLAAMY